jgi:hypothetical protein
MMSQTSGSNSGSTLLERNMADATKALEAATLKGRNLGDEVSRLQVIEYLVNFHMMRKIQSQDLFLGKSY